jgi:hypothetical protein
MQCSIVSLLLELPLELPRSMVYTIWKFNHLTLM